MERIVKYGEIYKLGDHRLMCGDSTMTDEVETLMGGVFRHGLHGSSVCACRQLDRCEWSQ